MPRLRIVRPIAAPTASTSSGSKLAPQDSGAGKTVACQVLRPVRHSSCTSAGMPKRLAATISRCGRGEPASTHRRGRRHRAERSRQLAEAVRDQLRPVDRGGRELVLVRRDACARVVESDPDAIELGDLLAPRSSRPSRSATRTSRGLARVLPAGPWRCRDVWGSHVVDASRVAHDRSGSVDGAGRLPHDELGGQRDVQLVRLFARHELAAGSRWTVGPSPGSAG